MQQIDAEPEHRVREVAERHAGDRKPREHERQREGGAKRVGDRPADAHVAFRQGGEEHEDHAGEPGVEERLLTSTAVTASAPAATTAPVRRERWAWTRHSTESVEGTAARSSPGV